MSIVCATRFTEESSFAVTVAAELARKRTEPLWLVHVLPAGLGVFQDGLDAGASDALTQQAGALAQAGLRVHTTRQNLLDALLLPRDRRIVQCCLYLRLCLDI